MDFYPQHHVCLSVKQQQSIMLTTLFFLPWLLGSRKNRKYLIHAKYSIHE